MKFKILKIKNPQTVEYNDWDGRYTVPGFARLRSVEPVPVADLPGAGNRQFGHETAFVEVQLKLRDFRHVAGSAKKGDVIDLEPIFYNRNKSDRKQGLCRARIDVDRISEAAAGAEASSETTGKKGQTR